MSNGHSTSIKGTGVVAGLAYARAVWVSPRPDLPTAGAEVPEERREAEFDRLAAAVDIVAQRLTTRSEGLDGSAADVLKVTAGMATDRGWRKAARKATTAGQDAENATVAATDKFIKLFESAGGVMAERTTDLRDIRDRVLAELRGDPEPGLPDVDGEAVLFADDLSPADTATLDTNSIVALVTELGGPTSHTAIIARQLNLPCIVAAGPALRDISPEEMVFIDGAMGTITIGTDEALSRVKVQESRERAAVVAQWRGPAQTRDGHKVQLLANVADGNAARLASEGQAEGIGLYRTELSFLTATKEPTVEDQAKVYRKVFDAFPHQKVVIRTLDAGSDKPIAYANMSAEENPALGVRGLRIANNNEPLLTRQLDAIALAAQGRGDDTPTWVMAPMVATAQEARWFAGLCRERGLTPGAMVEVPAAVLMADKLMPHLDFVSIGTNDLTQYTMAADRLSPQLAYLTDPWQPAVLRLIRHTCVVGYDTQTPVGVCGEAAADPLLACVLTGLGVDSLSAASTALPGVGAQLADVDLEQCKEAADAALNSVGAESAREAVRDMLLG